MDGLDAENEDRKTRHFLFWGRDCEPFCHLRVFGEVGVVKQGAKIKSKLQNRGLQCLHLGHADNHAKDVHRFLKLQTKKVIRSRDVKWLNKMFGDCHDMKKRLRKAKDEGDDEDSSGSEPEDSNEKEEETQIEDEKNKRLWTPMTMMRMNLKVLLWRQGG